MQTRWLVFVGIIGLALGIGWYVAAQDTTLRTDFQNGEVLFATDVNATNTQVNSNTAAISALTGATNQLQFTALLTGAQEVTLSPTPPPSPGVNTLTTGDITVVFDEGLTQAEFTLNVADAIGVTQAHFHCGRPGQNGPIVVFLFPIGATAAGPPTDVDGLLAGGTLTNVSTDANFLVTDCVPVIGRPVNNIASLFFAMRDGLIYANVHTAANPGGEIRSQLCGK
jgi:hypothetical protein